MKIQIVQFLICDYAKYLFAVMNKMECERLARRLINAPEYNELSERFAY